MGVSPSSPTTAVVMCPRVDRRVASSFGQNHRGLTLVVVGLLGIARALSPLQVSHSSTALVLNRHTNTTLKPSFTYLRGEGDEHQLLFYVEFFFTSLCGTTQRKAPGSIRKPSLPEGSCGLRVNPALIRFCRCGQTHCADGVLFCPAVRVNIALWTSLPSPE